MPTVSSYLGVWRPGGGEQRWFTGSVSAFHSADITYFNSGLRLVALDRHVGSFIDSDGIHLSPEDRMIGVWQAGTGAQYWVTGWDVDRFKSADQEYFAQGLRLVAVDTGGGGVTAVWRPGTGSQFWASGLSYNEFHQKDSEYFEQGLRLVAIDIDDGKFFGVWRSGSGPQQWLSAPYETFRQKNLECLEQGLRLIAVDHDGDQFFGVWHAGTGPEYWYTGLTVEQFKQTDFELFQQGLRLAAVDLGTMNVPSNGADSPTGTVARNLVLQENGPFTGAGGNSTWMYYSASVPANDPSSALAIKKIRNGSQFEINLTHNKGTTNLLPHAGTDYFNGDHIAGDWKAELIAVSGPMAPSAIGIDLTLGS